MSYGPRKSKKLTTEEIDKAVEATVSRPEIRLAPVNPPPPTIRRSTKSPGLKGAMYKPCFCGSGKKFKFCCYPKMKKGENI